MTNPFAPLELMRDNCESRCLTAGEIDDILKEVERLKAKESILDNWVKDDLKSTAADLTPLVLTEEERRRWITGYWNQMGDPEC